MMPLLIVVSGVLIAAPLRNRQKTLGQVRTLAASAAS
jgi:hypothetical protein